jgi:16S rRNA (guanine966-N2)-methyltransferase
MIRITAGRLKGRILETVPGLNVRPTAIRARQGIFNILAHGREYRGTTGQGALGPMPFGPMPLGGVRALDVFAGSGALGFEALSRGASQVTFIENARDVAALLKLNAERLNEASRVNVEIRNACKPGLVSGPPFGLAFLDPPYGEQLAAPALQGLAQGGWLDHGAIVVLETEAAEAAPVPEGFSLIEARRYGAARFNFLLFGARLAPAK